MQYACGSTSTDPTEMKVKSRIAFSQARRRTQHYGRRILEALDDRSSSRTRYRTQDPADKRRETRRWQTQVTKHHYNDETPHGPSHSSVHRTGPAVAQSLERRESSNMAPSTTTRGCMWISKPETSTQTPRAGSDRTERVTPTTTRRACNHVYGIRSIQGRRSARPLSQNPGTCEDASFQLQATTVPGLAGTAGGTHPT